MVDDDELVCVSNDEGRIEVIKCGFKHGWETQCLVVRGNDDAEINGACIGESWKVERVFEKFS